ncbi:MAG TPA: glycosyltransferase [Nitrospira sp.]|nr:glycosyltransferase [Nitrospira sp.]HNI68405.1 glycosyltransferase [Nitrospira sp.]
MWAIFCLLPQFDVIHYNAGTTLAMAYAVELSAHDGLRGLFRFCYTVYLRTLQRLEMAYVRLLRKRIFVTYQGDDARQGDFSLEHFPISIASEVEEGYYSATSDAFKRRNIALLCSMASQVYSVNPDLLYVLPKKARFIPYSHVFLNEWVPTYSLDEGRPLRILHAPTNRKVKGTDLILGALERIREQGHVFELLLVEGLSNDEAHRIYESADVLVDQLFAGWYGGLAVELMALGKPVLVYIREDDLGFIPVEMKSDLPFIQVTPQTIEAVLRQVLEMPREDLVALGRKSRAFVERWHDPIRIAEAIKIDYENALSERAVPCK